MASIIQGELVESSRFQSRSLAVRSVRRFTLTVRQLREHDGQARGRLEERQHAGAAEASDPEVELEGHVDSGARPTVEVDAGRPDGQAD